MEEFRRVEARQLGFRDINQPGGAPVETIPTQEDLARRQLGRDETDDTGTRD